MNKYDFEMIFNSLFDETPISGITMLKDSSLSIWIGSGLSKISAAYGAELIQQYTNNSSQLISALDYCKKNRLNGLPVLVSLKGENEDSLAVAKSIIDRGSKETILITGFPNGQASIKLSSVKLSTITAPLPNRDQRYVNMNSIFMLSSLVYKLISQTFSTDNFTLINKNSLQKAFKNATIYAPTISEKIFSISNWHNKQFIILGQGFISDLTLTWQAILSESGILNPIILDIKDYTHGDHLATIRVKNAIFLIIQSNDLEKIADIFKSRFSQKFEVLTIILTTLGPTQFWENLFYCSSVTSSLSSKLGYAGKRPPKDPLVHSWRGWGIL